ncbi:MAG: glycosyltransferase family 2 protein [Clostridiales bacterium]|nr:glycosyltransferase family 2 protein [Clostridiales bacterium]
MKLSFVIPCYNEEKNVQPMYKAVKDDLENCGFDYEIIFVNDGSSDGTLKELKKLLDGEIPVKIIDFSRNFGKESAMYAGLEESGGEYITIIDGDLQQRPSLALEMVSFLEKEKEYDCVAAFQNERGESKTLTFFKNRFYKLINRVTDTEFVQGASDFRTFRRPMAQSILEMKEYFRFSKGLFSWVGYKTYFIPYKAEERANGSSKWSFKKLFSYALDGIFSFSTTPLRFASVAGIITSLLSLIYLIVVIVQKLVFGIPVKGYATIVVLILLLGGMQLFALGIIGEYIARIYIQTKNRPIYIAKKIYKNFED